VSTNILCEENAVIRTTPLGYIITKGKSDDFMQRLENVLGEFYYFVFFKLFLSLNFSFV